MDESVSMPYKTHYVRIYVRIYVIYNSLRMNLIRDRMQFFIGEYVGHI